VLWLMIAGSILTSALLFFRSRKMARQITEGKSL
jgi:uncharacterized membrane protein YdjX (TVP38/TMEM64 family)